MGRNGAEPAEVSMSDVNLLSQVATAFDKAFFVGEAKFDGNCNLDVSFEDWSFRIFVDCGEFDYIERAQCPGISLLYGHHMLKALEHVIEEPVYQARFEELVKE